jgi:hypothetical protein
MALLNLPQLNYVVFEAVKFPITTTDTGKEQLGEPLQDKVLILDRLYTSIKYTHASLNNNTKFFGESYLTDKGGLAPVRIEMKGTFGYYALKRGSTYRTGFERFKEFRDELFNKVQSISDSLVENTLPDKKRYIYGLNFYDMINHFWGEVDLKEFLSSSDASVHTKLQMYEISMLGLNKLVSVASKDFLVTLIRQAIELQEIQEELEKDIMEWIENEPYLGELWRSIQSVKSLVGDLETGIGFAKEYIEQARQMNNLYNSISGGLSLLQNPLGNLISAGKSFIPILN